MTVEALAQEDTKRRGHDAGHIWARNRGLATELDCLRDLIRRHGLDLSEHYRGDADNPFRVADYLAFSILGLQKDEFNYIASLDFWQNAVGCTSEDDLRDSEFLQGFVNGALEVEHLVIEYGANQLEQ